MPPGKSQEERELGPADSMLLDLVIAVLTSVADGSSPCDMTSSPLLSRYAELVRFETGGDPSVSEHWTDTPKLVRDDLRAWVERGTIDLGDLSGHQKGSVLWGFLESTLKNPAVKSFITEAAKKRRR